MWVTYNGTPLSCGEKVLFIIPANETTKGERERGRREKGKREKGEKERWKRDERRDGSGRKDWMGRERGTRNMQAYHHSPISIIS